MKFNIWKDYKCRPLTELLSFIVDNRGKSVPLSEDGTNVLIATNCIKNENLYPTYENVRYFSDDVYENWFRAHPMPGDIIFVNKGTPGRTCMVPDIVDFSIAQDMMAFRVNEKLLDNRYLLCILRSREIQELIRLYSVGDTIPHFKKQFLKHIQIPVPPLNIQRYIGNMYFSFSEKMEINNRINRTLMEQAQAIYTEMFIANAKQSWKMGTLKDLILVKYGKDHKKLGEGVFPVYGSGGVMRFVERPLYEKESVLIPRKGTLNNVMHVSEPFWSVDTMFYTEMKRPNVAKFVFHFLSGINLTALNTGSAVPSMTTSILEAIQLKLPDEKTLELFEKMVSPMYDAVGCNQKESIMLENIREIFIPRLMVDGRYADNVEI